MKFKGFSESSENDEVSCSDVESDSGFESGHIFVSGSNGSTRSKAVAASKTDSGESDEDERIEKAILYLDEKVRCVSLLRTVCASYLCLFSVNSLPHYLTSALSQATPNFQCCTLKVGGPGTCLSLIHI